MFSSVQIDMLNMISHVTEESDFVAISNIISDYFAEKAERSISALWEGGEIDLQTIESWKDEHMRTQYSVGQFVCSE